MMVDDEHMVNENHFDNCHIPFLNLFLYPRKQAMDDLILAYKITELLIKIFKKIFTSKENSRKDNTQSETRS
jgi:hypothetical protein